MTVSRSHSANPDQSRLKKSNLNKGYYAESAGALSDVAQKSKLLPFHPCMHPKAHRQTARLHLPVAPKCNIGCGFCEREIGSAVQCVVAPGVSSAVLTPAEALHKATLFLGEWGPGAVIGIAGPGDPLANPETIETLKLIRRRFPEATLCLCTNGLNLPNALPELIATRVTHLTVTINGVDPSIVARIQSHITHEGRTYHGAAAAEILMRNQISGLTSAVRAGVFVKVNTVVVPEINGPHIVEIARTVSRLGATVFNPVPLIPRGGFRDMDKPTDDYMNRVRSQCGAFIPVFRHCKQCRADAEGIPGKEAAL